MNIFLILLSVLIITGYYMLSAPSQRIVEHETEYAVKKADLRSIAECVIAAQNASMYGEEFKDVCAERYEIESQYVCMNSTKTVVPCDSETGKVPDYNFIITSSSPVPLEEYNSVLEILEKYYPDAGTLGIFSNEELISASSITRRKIPKKIIDAAKLQDGQLIYIMQYKIPEASIEYPLEDETNIVCPTGTIKTFRFGRWQCIEYNYKISCTGDTIWDENAMECVADESRKPLCANNQTAVIVDDYWECIDPFPDKNCPKGMVARLNYNVLEWECVSDPNAETKTKKCDNIARPHRSYSGNIGSTLRVRSVSCTDCEIAVVDEETCETYCIPDAKKINDSTCYNGNPSECSGPTRGIYFGFNSKSKITGIPELQNTSILLDREHSQNRRFNCMDCGDREIDTESSIPPYTAVCK